MTGALPRMTIGSSRVVARLPEAAFTVAVALKNAHDARMATARGSKPPYP